MQNLQADSLGNAHLSAEEEGILYKMMWWMRRNPIHRIYLLYGIMLAPHQRLTLREMWRAERCGLKLSRGMSKTFLDGLFVDDKSLMYSNASSVVLTRGFRGGKLVMQEACEKIIANALGSQTKRLFSLNSLRKPANIINRGADLWQILYKHHSSVSTGPLGAAASSSSPLRGIRANAALVLDEASDINEEHYTSVVMPFGRVARDPVGLLQHTSNNLVYSKVESGTIRYDWQRYSRYLDELYAKMISGDESSSVVEFNYEDAFYYPGNDKTQDPIFTYRINLEDLYSEYESGLTNYADFLSENKNVVQGSRDQEFPSQLIDSITGIDPTQYFAIAHEHEIRVLQQCDDVCVIGIDPAREGADAAFVVIRVGPLRKKPVEYNDVVYAKTLFKAEFSVMHDLVRKLLEYYPNTRLVYMDQGGGGSAIRDLLWRPQGGHIPLYDPIYEGTPEDVKNSGSPILRLDAATPEKNTIRANYVKAQMEHKRFLLPGFIDEIGPGVAQIEEAGRTIRRLGRQFTYIVTKPVGNWKKYMVGEQRLKKDLFSATLLAMQGVQDLLQLNQENEHVNNEYGWV